ncbi:MAG: DUF1835 domain-containing protein [Solibacillus sp.]
MQTVHIIFGESAYGSLRCAMKEEQVKIIGFPSLLGEGPIQNIHTETGLKNRLQWLENNYLFDTEDIERYKQLFETGLQQVEQIAEGSKIIIWTCENAAEQFGIRFVAKLLAGKRSHAMYVIPFSMFLNHIKVEIHGVKFVIQVK